nr:anti-CBASS Acb1 family protein [uncultured Rhodoferax sp.]
MNIVVNTTDIARAREELAGWAGALDAKRPTAWSQYGYSDVIAFQQLLTAYERGGPAHGAVHRILDKCWQDLPRIKQLGADKGTPWEKKVGNLLKSVKAWAKLRDFDRRNMVGRYSALIYRVADNKDLREPLETASKLVDMIPLYENQIKVTQWHSDPGDSDNFGKPKMFQYRAHQPGAGDTQAQPDQWDDVHPSRVQILAEGSVGNMFEGVPLLKAGFNSLVDIEKISGGSAESYLKNSARTIVFKYDANASVQTITTQDGQTKTVRQAHEDQTRALNRNQDSSIVLQGGDASTLQTTTSDPGPAFEVAANLFAASVRIPFTILFGQQTGRLASNEDKEDMIARCVSRRTNELTPMLEEFVTRMQAVGIIEAGEFEIEWPPLDAPGDDAKYEQLDKLTTAMERAFRAGLAEPLFDANELRGVAGFEARVDDGMPTEGDPDQPDPDAVP